MPRVLATDSTTTRFAFAAALLLLALAGKAQTCRHGTLIRTGVTAEERTQILDTHNRLRSQVAQGSVPNQPGAQNMQEMVWDSELAYKAQQWAEQCTFDHDPSRYLNRFTMGQNLAIIWSTIPLADDDGDFPSRIQNWFNEVQKYAWGAQWSEATGHYSQLVWGDTNLIGCGFAYYKDSRRFNKLWVCNYGPGGNVVGSPPYDAGHPSCSNYGMQPSYRYSGLCYSHGQPNAALPEPSNSNQNSLQNNYIAHNGFTYKTETYSVPQPPQQPSQAPLQNVFKPIVQAVVQPVNNFINTDYSFKSIFDRFKDVLNLQRTNEPSGGAYNNNNGYQQSQYQPTGQQYQQPSYDAYQTYQAPAAPQPPPPAAQSVSGYYSQATASGAQAAGNNRNNPFLTYDWSQLFNQNSDKNNG